ncbi:penicillin acylase family protein [Microbacterium allomyrinae]|uniref:Penicillin acylase family protein n=1 Tax=Microbacterium allomyrinae TaxID=2830666 RepID=A0A9X1LTE0_9MICO|nr:penicillin acylase family protein [Microbacterium allomyrinae]MCC2031501.1 penicillin acylase family protein [Microbacterium allomyrinae]
MAEVYRDDHGIPHIRATDAGDLAEAQGEVTARDRGWQIEVDRLRASGRLAELIGESGVSWDVFARRARLDDTARRAYDTLDAESREFVRRYTVGVRRGMSPGRRDHGEGAGDVDAGADAAEFHELDRVFGDPRALTPWNDHDPLGVLHVAHALFSTFPLLLWREHVRVTLGNEWVDVFAGYGDETLPTSGSNGWALHGSRTGSGMPLLAGDPHRMFELPGVYQQVRLACDEFDVVGLAFPGAPGVPHFGHTGEAAWGVTNAIAHSVDVFRERLRATADGYDALGPDGWRPVDLERSVVQVRGGTDVEVEALETERGTIVTDLHDGGEQHGGERGEFVAWSIRMPARANSDLGGAALLPLLRARTAGDVVAAFSSWVDPVNRVLAADREGTVLSATVGVTPDRARDERRLPLAAETAHPAADRGVVDAISVTTVAVDANERPPERAGIDLGWAYPSSHRAERIGELLESLGPRTAAQFAPIWADTASGQAAALRGLLPADELAPAASRVRDALVAWDGRMDASSAAAGRFAAWRGALVRRVAAHPALTPLHRPHGFGPVFDPWLGATAQVAAALVHLVVHPALRDEMPAIVAAALEDASDAPPWGATHRLLPLHVLAGVDGSENPGATLDVDVSGDGDTVRCTGSTPGLTDRAWRGSVARWAWDLADREASLWSVPFGASGDPTSPHFADQLPAWADARPTRITTDWALLRPDTSTGAA